MGSGEINPVAIAPTFNNARTLPNILARLEALSVPIIVVNDGCTDGTDEYLASDDVPVPVTALRQPNSGPAAARNRGIDAAQGELVVFIDDDVALAAKLPGTQRLEIEAVLRDQGPVTMVFEPGGFVPAKWVELPKP